MAKRTLGESAWAHPERPRTLGESAWAHHERPRTLGESARAHPERPLLQQPIQRLKQLDRLPRRANFFHKGLRGKQLLERVGRLS